MEIWKDIVGYKGLYKISNHGKVKSLKRLVAYSCGGERIFKERIRKIQTVSKGYKAVILHKNNKPKQHLIHRLIAIHFIDNPESKPHINHINLNPSDNRIENLEWCTPSENMIHSFKYNKRKNAGHFANKIGKLHPRSKPVIKYSKDNIPICEYEGLMDAQRKTGILFTSILNNISGRTKSSGGFIWKYKLPYT